MGLGISPAVPLGSLAELSIGNDVNAQASAN